MNSGNKLVQGVNGKGDEGIICVKEKGVVNKKRRRVSNFKKFLSIFLLKTFLFVCAINPSLLNTLNPFNGHMDPRIINA